MSRKHPFFHVYPLGAFQPRARGPFGYGMALHGEMPASIDTGGGGGGGGDSGGGGGGGGGGGDSGPAPAPAPAPAPSGPDYTSQVIQMYRDILGREPDAGGLANNAALVNSGQMSIAQLASSMASSPEAQSNNIPAAQEQAGAAIYGGSAPAPSPTSQRAADAPGNVAQIYQEVLGRAPDSGAQGWIDSIANGSMGVDQVRAAIAQTPEAQNHANEQYVTALYNNVLQRPPDAASLQADVAALTSGQVSADWLAGNIASSQEAKNLAASGKTNELALQDKANQLVTQYNTNTGNLGLPVSYEKPVSQLDAITGAKMVGTEGTAEGQNLNVYLRPDGSRIYVDSSTNQVQYATPPYSAYANTADIRKGYRNMTYSSANAAKQQDGIMINGVKVPLMVPEYLVNDKGQVLADKNGNPVTIQQVTPQSGPSGFDSFMSAAVPALIIGTMTAGIGAPAAIGAAILGEAGAAATMLGGAIVGSGTQSFMAAVNGQDVGKAALNGAILGGAAASAGLVLDTAANFVGGGDAIEGFNTINNISEAIGKTPTQVAQMIANAGGAAVVAGANGGDAGTAFVNTLVTTGMGQYAGDLSKNLNLNQIAGASQVVSGITRVATSAALNDTSISNAITNNIAQIVVNAGVNSAIRSTTDAVKSTAEALKSSAIPTDYNKPATDLVSENKFPDKAIGTYVDNNGNVTTKDDPNALVILGGQGEAVKVADAANALKTNSPITLDGKSSTFVLQKLEGPFGSALMIGSALPVSSAASYFAPGPVNSAIENFAKVAANDAAWASSPEATAGLRALGLTSFAAGITALGGAGAATWATNFLQGNPAASQQLSNWVGPDDSSIAASIIRQQQLDTLTPEEFKSELPYLGNALPESSVTVSNPEGGALPKEVPQTPEPQTPPPALPPPEPGTPANDPLSNPEEPKVPGVPLVPILPTYPPAEIPEQPLLPGTNPATSPGTSPQTAPDLSPAPGQEPAPSPVPEPLPPAEVPAPQPQPQPELQPEVPVGPTGPTGPITTDIIPPSGPTGPTGPTGSSTSGGSPTGGSPTGGTPSGGTPSGGTSGGTTTGGTTKWTPLAGGTVPKMPVGPDLVNLVGGVSLGDESYKLIDSPFGDYNMEDTSSILGFAAGGSSTTTSNTGDTGIADLNSMFGSYLSGMLKLTPGVLKPRLDYSLAEESSFHPQTYQYAAEGGQIGEHQPEFFSEGGLNSLKNRFVKGDGDGTSDSVPAMLANGEFVIPADVVSSLGNGSNDSGAKVLDEFLKTIREHKRRADAKHLPADSKGPLAYLLEARKKVGK